MTQARTTNKKRRPRRSGKATARALASLRRAEAAVEYLAQGYTYATAASFVGFKSRQACHYAVMRLLESETVQAASTARALYERRLDELLQAIMPRGVAGDTFAAETALKVLDRIDRLHGLSKPTKIASTTPDGDSAMPMVAVLDITAALAKLDQYRDPAGGAAMIRSKESPDGR